MCILRKHRNLPLQRQGSLDMKLNAFIGTQPPKAAAKPLRGDIQGQSLREEGVGLASKGHTFPELLETCCLQSPPRLCC